MSNIRFLLLMAVVLFPASRFNAIAGDTANMEVHSSVPIACQAEIVSSQLLTITPLAINAVVRQTCNTTHDLSVTYNAASVISPSKLFITLEATLPSFKLSSAQVFAGLEPTESDKPVTIRYNAGTTAQRLELAQGWGITVTPR
ncbi:MAG: hypothetical protein ABL973_08960 [Micropepsaceae bacterium]